MNDKAQQLSPRVLSDFALNTRSENTDGSLCVSSAELLGDAGVATIIHHGQRYQLRQTKAGKLILTK